MEAKKSLNNWKSPNHQNLWNIPANLHYMISTPLGIIKQANTIFYHFLWNGPDKIKRNTMIAEYHQGGLKMPHFESIITTQKIMWAKRYLSFNFHPWKEFLNMELTKLVLITS